MTSTKRGTAKTRRPEKGLVPGAVSAAMRNDGRRPFCLQSDRGKHTGSKTRRSAKGASGKTWARQYKRKNGLTAATRSEYGKLSDGTPAAKRKADVQARGGKVKARCDMQSAKPIEVDVRDTQNS